MCRAFFALVFLAAFSYSATIESSAEKDCSRSFVQDTLLSKYEVFDQRFYFCKGYGETLGVAAVKLELREKARAANVVYEAGFYWQWSNPYYDASMGGTYLGGDHPNVDTYRITRGVISPSKPMAYSHKDADQLEVSVRLNFVADGIMDPERVPAIGDTLHWTLSFIYFHSSKMSIWYWNNTGTPEAWVGSDTMTIRYRTIMPDPFQPDGVTAWRTPSLDAGPVLGRYDLQGRPLGAGVGPAGLVFERTKQGFRKRLQLR